MGANLVVMLKPLNQDALEVASIDDQKPVETLPPGRANLALHM